VSQPGVLACGCVAVFGEFTSTEIVENCGKHTDWEALADVAEMVNMGRYLFHSSKRHADDRAGRELT